MKNSFGIIKTTLQGGLLFIVPVFVIIYILAQVFMKLDAAMRPITDKLQYKSVLGLSIPWIMIMLALLVICFLAGLLASTKPAKKMITWLEESLLGHIPGYAFMKQAGENVIGFSSEKSYQVILARIEDAWQIAFLVERIDDTNISVYVPGAPNPRSGSLYIMTNERIRELNITYGEAIHLIKNLGAGSAKHLKGKIPEYFK
jgi:uncharacterized membrane protein